MRRPLAKLHGDSSRARIITFLESIYQSVAENLPDVKELQDASVDGVELALHSPGTVFEDKYTDAINEQNLVSVSAPPQSKKDRIHCQIKSVKINEDRRPSKSGLEIRHLPPGHILDYWQQFRAADAEGGVAFSYFWREFWLMGFQISFDKSIWYFKMFGDVSFGRKIGLTVCISQVWYEEYPHLKFRSQSSHSICSECVRRRALIRGLGAHLCARKAQIELFAKHLRMQYQDRQAYWADRGHSRL